MRPLTVSVELARQATRRPSPGESECTQEVNSHHQRQISTDRHLEHPSSQKQKDDEVGDHEGQARPQDREQKIATGHRRSDEPLEQLGDSEIDQQEANAPEPTPHRIEPDQAGDQKVDVT